MLKLSGFECCLGDCLLLLNDLLCQTLANELLKIKLHRIWISSKLCLLFNQIGEHVLRGMLLVCVRSLELPLQEVVCCAVAAAVITTVQLVR
jgi:hypothetical protein